jgi:hypothetical protein
VTPRSTQLLGFKPPFVKDGEVAVPVLTGTGEWTEITATPVTWARMTRDIALAQEPIKPGADAKARGPITKPGTGRIL